MRNVDWMELERVLGAPLDKFCDAYWRSQPDWVQGGTITSRDARFLFRHAVKAAANPVVEIGTATGFSTGLLCWALDCLAKIGCIDADYRVLTYDIAAKCFRDPSKLIGDGARQQLTPAMLSHVVFRNPAVASDAARELGADGIALVFIDANHQHPWPTLDMLALVDSLRVGAVVVLHDINLPIIHAHHPDWGAKYLFDGLEGEKCVPDDGEIPNIGSYIIPADKAALRARLLEILYRHEWQTDVSDRVLKELGVQRPAK